MGDFLEMVIETAKQIKYKPGYQFLLGEADGRYYLQLENCQGVCSVSYTHKAWRGRKQSLSEYMCKQEIVGICFALVKDAEEHEMREWFKYKGVAIYSPHLDPDKLVEFVSDPSNTCTRPDQMTKV